MKSRKIKPRCFAEKCDGKKCKDFHVFSCGQWNEEKKVSCTLPSGHKGKHIACNLVRHNLRIWS